MPIAAVPVALSLTCPREKILRLFYGINGSTTYRCTGCEWQFTAGTQAPTSTATNSPTAGVTTALTVASGGASFTSGMLILVDTGANAEIVTVGPGATGTNVPVPGGFTKNHTTPAFGQLLNAPSFPVADTQPNNPGWGF